MGAKIILYSGENFEGYALEITESLVDLPKVTRVNREDFDWNDEVRSIVVVSGTWRIFQHGRCNTKLDDTALEVLDVRTKESAPGWSALLSATSRGPLELSSGTAGGFVRDISSVALVSGDNLPDWAAPRE